MAAALEVFTGKLYQPLADRLRRGLRRLAVQVRTRGCGSGRGIGHFGGIRRRHADRRERQTQFLSHNLRHFGKQSLPHLRTAVIQQQRSHRVDMYQGAGLIEVGRRDGDAEFDRAERNTAPDMRLRDVPLLNLAAPLLILRSLCQFVDDRDCAIARHHLP